MPMNKTMFDKNLSTLLTFKGIEFNRIQSDMLYGLLKDDFTDNEFGEICVEICKTCDLFNKYPDPKLFYDRKKKPDQQVLISEGLFYIDDTMPEYKPYLIGMSDDDILRVWKWIMNNKGCQSVEKSWIIERIKQFNPNYRHTDAIEKPCDEVRKLLTGSIKKI